MKRDIPFVGHAAVRVDVHMPHYEGFAEVDPQRIDRLAELIREAVINAIGQHALVEIGSIESIRHGISSNIHEGLGPAWTPEEGSQAIVPGSFSASEWKEDHSLECLNFYQEGARHVTIVASWS